MEKNYTLYNGDCLEEMKNLPDNSVDSIVTDPPYGISFMGKGWDHSVPSKEVWAEALRVLKPGGHLLAFAGTRTQHRMAVNIEDAGFEIRDMIAWVYGSGFPKSQNISKAIEKSGNDDANKWDGWGSALKPALEPITVARKPLEEKTIVKNVLKYGTGAINIEESRVATNPDVDDPSLGGKGSWKTDKAAKDVYEGGYSGEEISSSASGRFPANFIHDGSEEVTELFPNSKSCSSPSKAKPEGTIFGGARTQGAIYPGEDGSAARFFYCAKTSKKDRNGGVETNNHPTVKPTDLMRYLVRMVTPKGGTVLDPFMGSGSTGKGAVLEGFKFVGIELDPDYMKIAEARIKFADPADEVFDEETKEPETNQVDNLFDF